MRTIICKKCGAEIDASLGECPNCGAVYYILPEEEKKLEWAMSTDTDIDDTQVLGKDETTEIRSAAGHSTRDIINADNDELFNTRVWKLSEEQEEAKPVHPQAPAQVRRAEPARPVRQPTQAGVSRTAGGKTPPPQKDREQELRKKQLIVAAVALLAVLTLVLSFMGGLFNFTGNDDREEMQNLVGMPQESAMTILDALGLDVTVKQDEDEAAIGTVIKQSIKEGKKVKEGDKITITVSLGQATQTSEGVTYVEVPTLTGRTYDDAKQVLSELGLVIKRGEDVFSDKDIGLVISQSPMKGAKLETGATVIVTVSKGAEPSPSPTDHTISVTAGKGGSISPKGAVSVADGENQTFTITPDSGYEVFEVKVDGTSIGAATSYSFDNVTEDHTIYAVFRQKTATSPTPSASQNPSSGTDIG